MNKQLGKITVLAIISACFAMACQKDYSVEHYVGGTTTVPVTTPSTIAQGSLQDNLGNCQGVTVHGDYVKDTALTDNNYLSVSVTFSTTGKYKLYTDTLNGYWFSMDSAAATSTGQQVVSLKGHGTSNQASTAMFTIYFRSSSCSFAITTAALLPHVSAESDYFPMTVGSYCTYDTVETNPGKQDSIRYSVPNLPQITLDGQQYRQFVGSNNDKRYYRKDGAGKYYEYSTEFSSSLGIKFEYKMLDESVPVGGSWQTPQMNVIFSGTILKGKITSTIISKGLSSEFTSPNIDSVIEVDQQLSLLGTDGTDYGAGVSAIKTYFAKKIGLVKYYSPSSPSNSYLKARGWYIQ
ncbi:hypothetical protein [Parasediminibacterium sp. JCM 36343]|uniref:hypothetical protein n=1 Tax=Parasediminibacterium sp. JCM 36343 TaxID=3374279 RepID=UPI00397DA5E2